MRQYKLHPIPEWMHIDTRPLDQGEFQRFGYGYSRPVTNYERWRPATRYIGRKDENGFRNYAIFTLMPGRYFVSDHGRIWSAYKNKIIKYKRHKRSRARLILANGNSIYIRPYKLVLDNFVEVPDRQKNLVYYLLNVVNHINNHPWDNRASNLQYTTQEMNINHSKLFHKKE